MIVWPTVRRRDFWILKSGIELSLPHYLHSCPGRGGVYSTQLFSPMNSSKISPKYMGCGECSPKSMYNNVHLKRKRGGGWCFFTQIEPNWPLPYSTVPVQWLRDARPTGWVTYCSICMRETMPRAQNRAGKGSILHIVKTIGFYNLVIIYLWFDR